MTEPLHVGQFGIVDHEPVDRGPSAGIFHGRGPAGDRAELFAVAEGTTPAGEAFAPHVVSAIGQLWSSLDMSVTGALSRCFEEADRNVADWNRKSIAQHRVAIGLTCLARKGDQAVIAQAGPTIAFHLSGQSLAVYEPGEECCQPFGAGDPPKPEFTRIDLLPGDRVLILSTVAMLDLDPGLVHGILGLAGPQVLQDLYRRVQHLRNLTVLLVEVPGAAVALRREAPPARASQGDTIIGEPRNNPQPRHDAQAHPGFQPSLFIETTNPELRSEVEAARAKLSHISERARMRSVAPANVAAELPPLQRAVGDTEALRQIAAEQHLRATISQAMVVATGPGSPALAAATTPGGERERTPGPAPAATTASFSRSLVPQRAPQPPSLAMGDAPLASEMAANRRNRQQALAQTTFGDESTATLAATPLVRPRTTMGGRWRGSGRLTRRSAVRAQAPSTRLVAAIGLAVLLAVVAVVTLPGMLSSDDAGRAQELINSAEQQIAAARVQDNPTERRAAFTEAHKLLLEAEQTGGASTTTRSLINEVAGAISSMDAVVEPERVETIASFAAFGDRPVTPADIAIGDGVAYLLDTTSAQVIAQPLDGTQATVVYREDAALQQGRPTALAFYRTGAGDGDGGLLLIADSTGALRSLEGETLARLDLAVPAGTNPTDIALFDGDLYILDAPAGRVLRLTGAGGTFPYESTVALQSDGLKDAVHFMVDDEIITSAEDGSLLRYSGDLTLALSQAGIDRPLVAAATPWAIDEGHIALADPANDRVVVLNRDGTFVRQYRMAAFEGMTALGMRDDAGFVYAGNTLLRITW